MCSLVYIIHAYNIYVLGTVSIVSYVHVQDTEYMKAREAARIQEQVLGMANQIR